MSIFVQRTVHMPLVLQVTATPHITCSLDSAVYVNVLSSSSLHLALLESDSETEEAKAKAIQGTKNT